VKGQPLDSHGLEGVAVQYLVTQLAHLAGRSGVNALLQLPPRISGTLARVLEADSWIYPQGQGLALARVAVVPTPVLARPLHQQIKPGLIGQFARLVGGLGIAAGGIREGHDGISMGWWAKYRQKYRQKVLDASGL